VVKGSSSLNLREKWTIPESNFQPCKGKPNSHAWNTKGLFRSNHLAFIPTRGSDPPQATAGPYALPKCRTYACSATTCPYSWLPLQHVFPHIESSNQKKQIRVVGGMSTPRADWLLGLPLTQNSRHVVSTFKRLTRTTTNCDLIKFNNTDGASRHS
jgi:hypothetical protein